MKSIQTSLFAGAVLALGLTFSAEAQQSIAPPETEQQPVQSNEEPVLKGQSSQTPALTETDEPKAITLHVDLSDRQLHVREGDETIRTYDVSVGTSKHPTPEGDFKIARMIWNPDWVPPAKEWAKGKEPKKPGEPGNPMRVVKLYFKQPDYYIHGTNKPESLGTAASHGCVRMGEEDVMELGKIVMEHGGAARPESWFRRVLRLKKANVVRLAQPVRVIVQK